MTLPVKLAKLGRSRRVTTFNEAQRQVDEIRAKVDDLIQAIDNLDENVNTPSGGSTIVVNSLSANGGAQRSGNITFTDTASVTVGNVANNFTFTAITPFTTPAVTYGTAYAAGVSGSTIRSDATLVYPEALAVAADRTKTLTLTDAGGTTGATLTPGALFGANYLSLYAPNGTRKVSIGPLGTMAVYDGAANDNIALQFSINATSATIQQGLTASAANAGTGGVLGALFSVGNTGTNAVENLGCDTSVSSTNANTTGILTCYKARITISGNAKTTASASMFKSVPGSISGSTATLTALNQFWAISPSLSTIATLTTHRGFYCEALKTGTTRVGHDCDGFTTGTPTVSYGYRSLSHSVGTTRRSFIGDNTAEMTTNHWYCSTANKGLLMKDTQGTPEYWAFYIDSTGTKDMTMTVDASGFASFTRAASATGNVTLNAIDTGITAPAT